jgi:ATP-dependent Lon protease
MVLEDSEITSSYLRVRHAARRILARHGRGVPQICLESSSAVGRLHSDRQVSILLAAQRDPVTKEPSRFDLYQVGTIGRVSVAMRLPDGTIKAIIETKERARVGRFVFDEDFTKAEAEQIEEPVLSDPRLENLVPLVISALIAKRAKTFGEENTVGWSVSATTTDRASVLADRIASELHMDLTGKQALLELLNPADRLEKLLAYLNASS